MKSLFEYICNNYNHCKTEEFSNNIMGKKLRHELPNKIFTLLNLDKDKFEITGSIGQGQWAEIPWISIFLKNITTSATKGYYIVYLFKADMSGFYLSLNQGWTYFKEKYGTSIGREKIKNISNIMRNKLFPISERFNCYDIDLVTSKSLGKGYELGHICGCYYDAKNIPSNDILIHDLKSLIIEYEKLHNFIGNISVESFNDFLLLNSDNKFLDTVEEDVKFTLQSEEIISKTLSIEKEIMPKGIIDEPIDVPNPIIRYAGNKVWPRNAYISANSIVHSNYKCSFNNSHQSFTSNKTKKPYMEPHHLIPLSQQDKFPVSLDVEANIVSLCSNCHNCVHYGTDEEKAEILIKLFNSRKDRLEKCGIKITLEELLKIYRVPLNVKAYSH